MAANKVDLEQIEFSMSEAGVKQEQIDIVIGNLKKAIEQENLEKEEKKKKRTKKVKYVLVNSKMPENTPITEYPMLVVEAEEDVPHTEVVGRICRGIKQVNANVAKFSKNPLSKVFEATECPQKHMTQHQVKVVTKDIVMVLETDNVVK